MNKAQALAKAIELWGKTAGVHDLGPKMASTPERRAAALAQLHAMTREERRANRRVEAQLMSESSRFRYRVCALMFGMFFEIKGTGDTWEDAFADVELRRPKP